MTLETFPCPSASFPIFPSAWLTNSPTHWRIIRQPSQQLPGSTAHDSPTGPGSTTVHGSPMHITVYRYNGKYKIKSVPQEKPVAIPALKQLVFKMKHMHGLVCPSPGSHLLLHVRRCTNNHRKNHCQVSSQGSRSWTWIGFCI